MANKTLNPIHLGEALLGEFLVPMAIRQYRLVKDIHVPPRRINEIVHGKRAITADIAQRISLYFGTTAEYWSNLQSACNLDVARQDVGSKLEKEI